MWLLYSWKLFEETIFFHNVKLACGWVAITKFLFMVGTKVSFHHQSNTIFILSTLTLSWRRCLSYRNQSIDLSCKSMGWFLYDRDIRHGRIKPFYATGFFTGLFLSEGKRPVAWNGLMICIWVKVLKNGPSKIYKRQPLKNLKGYSLPKQTINFLKAVLHKFYLVHSWIPWPIYD